MAVTLNHTIVHCTDKHVSASFLAELLDLPAPVAYGPFLIVRVGDTSLDFADDHHGPDGFQRMHYAFLVTEAEFDQIWHRIRTRGLTFWAGPGHRGAGSINHGDGGRGLYWDDPDGHSLEILTVPYGGW